MYKINHIYDIQKSISSKEIKDKVQIIENKDFAIFLLFDGLDSDVNSQRGISAFNKYVKNNYLNYLRKDKFEIKDLIFDADKKVFDLGMPNLKFGLIFLYNDKKSGNSVFSIMGKLALYTYTHDLLTRIAYKKNTKVSYIGEKKIEKDDISENYIKNPQAPIFLCSDGFLSLLAEKRKDIIKIINHKDLKSAKAAMARVMKSKNQKNYSYILVKKKKLT